MKFKATFYLIFILVSQVFSQNIERDSPLYVDYRQSMWVDSILSNMSLREKIAQLFFIDSFNKEEVSNKNKVKDLVKNHNVGGVIFFEGDPNDQALFCNELQSLSKIPLLISMDAEWGVSMRLDSTQKLPYQIQIAASGDTNNSYLISEVISGELKRMGVHMNFAPVADLNSNPKNPIIGNRSFGENRERVAAMAVAASNAYKNNNILSAAKHFPGHGDTSTDSHKTLPLVSADIKKLDSIELYPFKQLILSGLNSIMVGHLNVPSLDNKYPSSLSENVVDSLLKTKFEFKGLIMPDALNMRGARTFGDPVKVNIQAFKAGHDALLFCEKVEESIDEMEVQFKQGKLNYDQLDNSVRKILQAKYYVGLSNYTPIDTSSLIRGLNSLKSASIVEKVISESITVIKNNEDLLPLIDVENKIAHLTYGADNFEEFSRISSNYCQVDNFIINSDNFDKYNSELKGYSRIIVSINSPYTKNLSRFSQYQYNQKIKNHIALLSEHSKIIFNFSNSPYRLFRYIADNNVDAIVLSYAKSDISQKYSSTSIFGAQDVKGILPVSINSKYRESASVKFNSIGRIGYSTAYLEGMDTLRICEIDSLIMRSVADTVFPGAQVLIAKNGKIIYDKSFGYATYEKKKEINNNMLYDLASLTKILAGVPLLMRLYEQGKIKLDDKLSLYIEGADSTAIGDISIREMMAHYAKLPPGIDFYTQTLNNDGSINKKDYYSFNLSSKNNIRVGDNLFLRSDFKDSIHKKLVNVELLDTLEYRYSDLPYYFLNEIFDSAFRKNISEELNSYLYKPLGLNKLNYKPLNRFNKSDIVPSEVDEYFRNRELRGHVNDPGAALLGGVSSHAGLFSNAFDVAVIMQMYLQNGYYGGKRYFSPSTVEQFSSCQYCDKNNRRGIGFDKPELSEGGPSGEGASYLSFGHSGFTGTLAWADPNNNIVFIFLSNRTYPTSKNNKLLEKNIRTELHELVYKAIVYEK